MLMTSENYNLVAGSKIVILTYFLRAYALTNLIAFYRATSMNFVL
jgi:hypothetical protein